MDTVREVLEVPKLSERWSFARRLIFRFVCCYWIAYALPARGRPTILQALPNVSVFFRPYLRFTEVAQRWVGVHVFGVPGLATKQFERGSETILDYFGVFNLLVLAFAATVIWTALDRSRPEYRTVAKWVRLMVRYAVALNMLSYGLMKVIPVQFQTSLGMARLMEPFGEFSPSGVLWNFMAASVPYTVFAGAVEVVGGLLLLFRPTVIVGAAVSAAAMLNVLLLNCFYDVGVKIGSAHLLMMAIFLLVPALHPTFALLVLKRPATLPMVDDSLIERRGLRFLTGCVALLFWGYNLLSLTGWASIPSLWRQYKNIYITPIHSPLYGLYRVESGGANGWAKIAFDGPGRAAVRTVDDSVQWFSTEYNTSQNALLLNTKDQHAAFVWRWSDSSHLVLQGTYQEAPISLQLKRIDLDLMLIKRRGFYWTSEEYWNK